MHSISSSVSCVSLQKSSPAVPHDFLTYYTILILHTATSVEIILDFLYRQWKEKSSFRLKLMGIILDVHLEGRGGGTALKKEI